MAAGKIAGITIEIGGDTTKLGKALKDVNGTIRETQSNLKDVNKLLKMDPGNVDLLTQKQKYLGQAIEDTKKKLDIEKEALEQLKAGPQTEETIKQQEALTREIAETEQKLESLEKEYKEFGSVSAQQLKNAGTKIKAFGDNVTKVGKALAPVSAAAAGIGAAGIAAAKELDEGYDIIIKKTGAVGEAFEDLKEEADDVFTSMPVTMEQAGTAIGEVNTRFGTTGDALENLSKLFLQFAEINDTDLNSAIANTDKLMEQYGIDIQDAAGFLGLITQKSQETGLSVDSLMDSLQKNGAYFKELGLSVEDSAELLAQFEANGVNAEEALGGLRKAVQNYAADGLTADEALRQTIESIKTASSETEALAMAQEVFGKKGAAEMVKAIQEGRINIDDLSGSMQNYAGVVEQTFSGTQDTWDKWTTATNNAKKVMSELGDELMDVLAPILDDVMGKLQEFAEWFDQLDDGTKRNIVTIGIFVAALAPVLIVVGQVIGAIGTIIEMFPVVAAGISGLAGPIALVVGAIAGAILIWQNWDQIMADTSADIEEFKSSWDVFVDGMKSSGTDLKNNFKQNWEQLKTDLGNAVDAMKSKVSAGIKAIENIFAKAKLELPKIKLPHFKISGKFSLNPPQKPDISVEWYGKAMDEGVILNNPTIFGAAGGRLLGAGEAGPEAVVGVNSLRGMIRDAVGAAPVTVGDTVVNVYQQPGENMNQFVDRVMERMDEVYAMQRQAWGRT